MHNRFLFAALAGLAIALGMLVWLGAADSTRSPGKPTGSAAAWELIAPVDGVHPARRSASGLDELPDDALMAVRPGLAPPGNADRLRLPLPGDGDAVWPVRRRTTHDNGDVTVHLGRGAPGSPRATLTFGHRGQYGRIRTADTTYMLHSDAGGSWLVDLEDERLDVDDFAHDTLGAPARAAAHAATGHHSASAAGMRATPVSGSAPAGTNILPGATIDVMFIYTPDMLERYPDGMIDTRLNHLVAIANQTMVDTDTVIAVRLVHHQAVGYPPSRDNGETLQDLREALNGDFVPGLDDLDDLRDEHGADIVAFTWPHDIETRGSCGIAYFPFQPEGEDWDTTTGVHIDNDGVSNWSVCSDAVFTHELGHNLNAEHQRSQSSGDDPDRRNYAWIVENRYHTIMGSFGTGNRNRYLRLNLFSNPDIDCGGAPCGSTEQGEGADNAATISGFARIVSDYRTPVDPPELTRPDPSMSDQDGDGQVDRDDPYPFDPYNGDPGPQPDPLMFSQRAIADGGDPDDFELLVVSSGNDRVVSYGLDGSLRGTVANARPTDAGPILTDYSDLATDGSGRIYLLSSADVHRYDRLSGRLIDVFASSRRPDPQDLISAFPRALELVGNRVVVLGDNAIERFDLSGTPLTPRGGEATSDPSNWNEALDLNLRALAADEDTLYVAEADNNVIFTFDLDTGQRLDDLAGAGTGIVDPQDLRFGPDGRLYLANGVGDNVLRFDPDTGEAGAFIAADADALHDARALAFGPDGHAYVTSADDAEIRRFDGQTGAFIDVVASAGDGQLDQPQDLVVVPRLDETVAGHSGHFWLPERSGEGWIVEFLQQGGATVSWFTYPPEGDAREQAWIVGFGDVQGNRIVVDEMLEARINDPGGGFGGFDPDDVELIPWGSLEVTFSNCNHGVASWQRVDGGDSGQLRFERLIELPGLPCGDQPRQPTPSSPGVSGQWYDPAYNGQGWFLQETQNGDVFMAWFTYDPDGNQIWIVGNGSFEGDELVFAETTITRGTFFGDAFEAGAIESENFGTLRFEFDDCQTAEVVFDSELAEYGSGSFDAERLTRIDRLDCALPEASAQ